MIYFKGKRKIFKKYFKKIDLYRLREMFAQSLDL